MTKSRILKGDYEINDLIDVSQKSPKRKKMAKRGGTTKWTNGEYTSLINLVR